MGATHTDIASGGWVSRAPARLRPALLLLRLDRPVGVWLLFLPGAWGLLLARAPWGRTAGLLALFGLGSLAMRGAGCVINDMWDRDIDARVARTAGRPLASGAMTMRAAWGVLALCAAVALWVLLLLDPLAIALGVAAVPLVALYPLAKRVTWWPQLVMGLPFAAGAPIGMAAAQGRPSWAMAALYVGAIAWDTGFDTIYGFQDMEDDRRLGVRSTSRRFAHAPRVFLGVCYAVSLGGLGAAGLLAGLPVWFAGLLGGPALLFARQVWRLAPNDPATCLTLFRSNVTVGWVVSLCIVVARVAM